MDIKCKGCGNVADSEFCECCGARLREAKQENELVSDLKKLVKAKFFYPVLLVLLVVALFMVNRVIRTYDLDYYMMGWGMRLAVITPMLFAAYKTVKLLLRLHSERHR